MTTITIPKKITKGRDLVIMPREEYERFLRFKELIRKEKNVTEAAIEEGLSDLEAGRVSPTFNSAKAAIRYLHRQAKKFNQSQ